MCWGSWPRRNIGDVFPSPTIGPATSFIQVRHMPFCKPSEGMMIRVQYGTAYRIPMYTTVLQMLTVTFTLHADTTGYSPILYYPYVFFGQTFLSCRRWHRSHQKTRGLKTSLSGTKSETLLGIWRDATSGRSSTQFYQMPMLEKG